MWSAESATDPDNGGSSLINACEVVIPCLESAGARSLIEVGAGGGALTRELLGWARAGGATVAAIDPTPADEVVKLAEQEPELELVTLTSLEALATMPLADALILDGDHNYFTLHSELELIAERSRDGATPLIILHDIGWPHARRDTYYAPERIPPEHRQPLAQNASLAPDEPGVAAGGIPFAWAAAREGGPANGVLTAIEDFLADHDGLAFARIPAFWGVGVIWPKDAPYAPDLARTLEPWADNALLERLERHRVAHLVGLCQTIGELSELQGVSAKHEMVIAAQTELLERMKVSSALGIAERLSRLRQGGKPIFSRDQIERVLSLADDNDDASAATEVSPGRDVSGSANGASAARPASGPAASAAS